MANKKLIALGERFTMNYWLYLFSFIFCNRLVVKPKDGNAFFLFFVGFTDMVLVCYRPGYATALGNLKIHTQQSQLLLGFVFCFLFFNVFKILPSTSQGHPWTTTQHSTASMQGRIPRHSTKHAVRIPRRSTKHSVTQYESFTCSTFSCV